MRAVSGLLEHVAQTTDLGQPWRSVFRFNAAAPRWTPVAAESAFQLQLALPYRF
jgi:hypothetical protein